MTEERRWSVTAILIGAMVDIGGSFAVGMMIVVIEGVKLVAKGVPQEELTARLNADTGYLISAMVIGLFFSAVGGFVAAKLARRRELAHGAGAAALSLLFGLAMADSSVDVLVWDVLSYGLVLPAALLGAAIGRARNRRTVH